MLRSETWASHAVQASFQALVNQLVAFHDGWGKSKNQLDFNNIHLALSETVNFIYRKDISDGAEQVVATISTGIFQTLISIGVKKSGKEDNAAFIESLLKVGRELSLFRNACEGEIAKRKKNDSMQSTQSTESAMSVELTDVLAEDDNNNRIKQKGPFTYLDSKQELMNKIKSIGTLPDQHFSIFSLFKRAARYYPKAIAASLALELVGLGIGGIELLDRYLGHVLDALLHSDQTGVTYERLLACFFLVTGTTIGTTVLIKSSTCKPCHQKSDLKMLTDLVETPEDKQPLLENASPAYTP